jgi:lipopolysaccharide/colanic/teichoic acid biosynthesis glycosyltransferase
MSSHSTPVLGGLTPDRPNPRLLKFRQTIALALPFGIGVAASENSNHLPMAAALVGFIVVALISAFSAYRYPQIPSSPLHIDRTVRSIRSIFAALPAAICAVLLVPEFRTVAFRSLVTFAFFVAGCRLGVRRRTEDDGTGAATASHRSMGGHRLLKRTCDILVASFALIILTPLFVIIAIAVKLGSEGPVFFMHERVGDQGRVFRMIKFRSMYTGVARYARSPVHERDPRITAVGRVIRRFSLDEFPQLFNVLLGEMSLVGPRPEMPFIVRDYSAEQRERLNAVPGVTGLWQISTARALPIHENMQYDLYYIAHQDFFLDAAILLRTARAVVRGIGAR